ncbi:hypothetical protein CCR85_09315 [Rhodothalassium salexigens]|uniref:glycosyltransferase n=1 Tax=Rhodothalassium salexigens TaxID=1086 RepID=UPI0019139ABF|nr:glycosyltransferase [Rhodothalassium salexigens]MBK5911684.1 hypothetical protein [Rhodothalassium salexigens]
MFATLSYILAHGAALAGLAAARPGFFRADERLTRRPPDSPADAGWPTVTAVVPARDEAPTIAACVQALAAQDYPGRLRVIVVDDQSSDNTAAIAAEAGADARVPVEVITAPPLKPGWSGKIAALDAGLAHAAKVAPDTDFYWFTDADIVHDPRVLRDLTAKADEADAALVSLMVRLACTSVWEKLLVPAFVLFFQMLYPFRLVNTPGHPMAAAAGGCILVSRPVLDAAGGLDRIKGALIDDCSLAALIKRQGRPIWLGLAEHSRSLRRYERLGEFWHMVKRTAFVQLGFSPWLLIVTVAFMSALFIVPPALGLVDRLVWAATGQGWLFPAGWLGWVAALAPWAGLAILRRPTDRYYALSVAWAPTLAVAATLYTAMTVHSALAHWRGAGGAWKGRVYDHG